MNQYRDWPAEDNGRVPTKNNSGFMFPHLSSLSERFIEHAVKSKYPVIDIGCAYGVSVLPILMDKNATCEVVALDDYQEHLDILKKSAPEFSLHRLKTIKAKFPDEFSFSNNYFEAIQISFLLQVFRGSELQRVLKICFNTLRPGGKLYLYTASIYFKFWREKFAPLYEKKKSEGVEWPGEMENQYEYLPAEFKPSEKVLSQFMHVYKLEDLVKEVRLAGFEIDDAYYDDIKGVDGYESDEKGMISIIASKP